jgi:hypothetical protein
MWKIQILTVLLASTTMLAFADDNASVGGKWKVHINVAGTERDMACTIVEKDTSLTGTCKGEDAEGNLAGSVDGKKVAWTYNSEYDGSPVTSKYSGTFDPATNKITGTLSVVEYSVDGDFTAVPAK